MNQMFATEIWDCDILNKGDVIGHWRVDDYLGAGGGGAVYHVAEVNGTRSGALKIFRGDLEKDVHHGMERTLQERRLISRLQSARGMPKLYDQGEYKGRPYFVREDLDPIEPDELPSDNGGLCLFLYHLLYSLKSLHDIGWVHCDIKPWNIARKKGDRLCVLIDFGSDIVLRRVSMFTFGGNRRSIRLTGNMPAAERMVTMLQRIHLLLRVISMPLGMLSAIALPRKCHQNGG